MSRYLSFASVFFLFLIFSCQKEKSFEQGKISKGSLQGAFGDCLSKTVTGTYTAAKGLTDSNYIDVDVDVAEAGRYTVYTDTVNGYYFRGTGTFTTVGSHTVRMKGFGTPASEGTDDFTVVYDSTVCSVSVTVVSGSGGGTSTGLHFPLTANSYWTYNDPNSSSSTDTIKRTNTGTTTFSGNTYQVFEEADVTGPYTEYYYRKSGNNYYEWAYVDDYSIMSFDGNGIEGDILFLKEGLNTNDTWFSSEYSGTVGGIATKLRYSFKCVDANASVTINNHTYSNVYKITYKPQVSTSGGQYVDEGVTWDAYFAKDVGLIDWKGTDGTSTYEIKLRYYKVF